MLYLPNKYTKWYYQIISNALLRIENIGYTESHHIIPKSLGGGDQKENLVNLTAKEHFVCHHLLTKMTVGDSKKKMCYAFRCLCILKNSYQDRIKVTAKQFAMSKELVKQYIVNGRTHSEETKNKISKANKGRPNKYKGMPTGRTIDYTEEVRDKISQSKLGKKRKPFSEETKQKMSASGKGRVFTDEHKRKISESNKKRAANKKIMDEIQK